jgi:basic membrane protein A
VLAAAGWTSTKSVHAAAAAPAKHAAAVKVGLVTDTGGLNDRSFNHLAYVGLLKAQSTLGATIEVKESKSSNDYIPNLQAEAANGDNLVVGVGFLMADAIGKVAKAYPNVKFAIIDDSSADPAIGGAKNVQGLLFKEQESGYLAGYLSGLLEKKKPRFQRMNGKQVVSTVGGQKIPPVDHYIAGFIAGVKKADPGVTELNGYSNDFNAQDKCKGIATSQISRGSDVVFQVAGGCGLGALDAARAKGVWGIGVDSDQSLQPGVDKKSLLASAIKRVDQAVFLTAQAVQKGTYKGGVDTTFGLKQNGTGIAGINKAIPASIVAKVNKIKAQIVSGKIVPPNKVK